MENYYQQGDLQVLQNNKEPTVLHPDENILSITDTEPGTKEFFYDASPNTQNQSVWSYWYGLYSITNCSLVD